MDDERYWLRLLLNLTTTELVAMAELEDELGIWGFLANWDGQDGVGASP
jgi:hypothetical protein